MMPKNIFLGIKKLFMMKDIFNSILMKLVGIILIIMGLATLIDVFEQSTIITGENFWQGLMSGMTRLAMGSIRTIPLIGHTVYQLQNPRFNFLLGFLCLLCGVIFCFSRRKRNVASWNAQYPIETSTKYFINIETYRYWWSGICSLIAWYAIFRI